MLNKPKYMLPGNLSQGAPILEPDENGDYNFSFAFDGDEPIKEVALNIFSLQGHKIANEDIPIDLENLKTVLQSYTLYQRGEQICCDITLKLEEEYSQKIDNFVPIDNSITFAQSYVNLYFDNVLNNKGETLKTKLASPDFLKQTTYKSLYNESKAVEAYEPQAAILPILISKTGHDMLKKGRYYMTLGPFCFFERFQGQTSCSVIKEESGECWLIKLEPQEIVFSSSFYITDFENFFYNFSEKDEYLFPYGIRLINPDVYLHYSLGKDGYSYNEYVENPTTNLSFWSSRHRNYAHYGGHFYRHSYYSFYGEDEFALDPKVKPYSDKSVISIPNKIDVIEFDRNHYKIPLEIALSSEDKEVNFKCDKEYLNKLFTIPLGPSDEISTLIAEETYMMFRINKQFFLDNGINISGTIKHNNIENSIVYKDIIKFSPVCYPKDKNGNFNFIVFKVNKNNNFLFNNSNYFWTAIVQGDNNIPITSDMQNFVIKQQDSSYSFYFNVINNMCGVQKNNAFIDYDIIEYEYEIKNEKNELYYKSPLIKSSNMQFTQLPIYSLPSKDYKIYFTAINKNMQTIKLNAILPESKYEGLKLNYNYNPVEKKLNFSFTSDEFKEYIKSYILYRYDIKNDKYFIVKNDLTQKDGIIEVIDELNNSEKFQYFISVIWDRYYLPGFEPQYEHSNFSSVFINDEKKWRLILTKEKKSDIIYSVDKVYDFYYNLVSGSIGNNAETTINTNFTNMPSVQKGFSNYWSGSLSALMGVCDERGEFAQTIEQEKALEQLVLDQEHDKFLLDREGNIWQVEISAPLTIVNQDGLVQIDKLIDLKTITINWVQVGSPTQIIFDFEE